MQNVFFSIFFYLLIAFFKTNQPACWLHWKSQFPTGDCRLDLPNVQPSMCNRLSPISIGELIFTDKLNPYKSISIFGLKKLRYSASRLTEYLNFWAFSGIFKGNVR